MQALPPSGPTILGFDVIYIATMLSAVATFAVMLAIYAATTVKDPMARRLILRLDMHSAPTATGH